MNSWKTIRTLMIDQLQSCNDEDEFYQVIEIIVAAYKKTERDICEDIKRKIYNDISIAKNVHCIHVNSNNRDDIDDLISILNRMKNKNKGN